jgi:hypothetical protein
MYLYAFLFKKLKVLDAHQYMPPTDVSLTHFSSFHESTYCKRQEIRDKCFCVSYTRLDWLFFLREKKKIKFTQLSINFNSFRTSLLLHYFAHPWQSSRRRSHRSSWSVNILILTKFWHHLHCYSFSGQILRCASSSRYSKCKAHLGQSAGRRSHAVSCSATLSFLTSWWQWWQLISTKLQFYSKCCSSSSLRICSPQPTDGQVTILNTHCSACLATYSYLIISLQPSFSLWQRNSRFDRKFFSIGKQRYSR